VSTYRARIYIYICVYICTYTNRKINIGSDREVGRVDNTSIEM